MIATYLIAALIGGATILGTPVPTVDMVHPNPPEMIKAGADVTYRVGEWTCLSVDPDPAVDPCVYEPDPEANPVPFEPDSGPFTPRGQLAEDAPGDGWDCRTMGNRVCGPGQPWPAGCYSGGILDIPWAEITSTDYHPCGGATAEDRGNDDRLAGLIDRLCAVNQRGGTTCWYADRPTPTGPAAPVGTPYRV